MILSRVLGRFLFFARPIRFDLGRTTIPRLSRAGEKTKTKNAAARASRKREVRGPQLPGAAAAAAAAAGGAPGAPRRSRRPQEAAGSGARASEAAGSMGAFRGPIVPKRVPWCGGSKGKPNPEGFLVPHEDGKKGSFSYLDPLGFLVASPAIPVQQSFLAVASWNQLGASEFHPRVSHRGSEDSPVLGSHFKS